MQRRDFLQGLLGVSFIVLMSPVQVLAAIWNRAAFEATKVRDAAKSLAMEQEIPSQEIRIVAPDKAENGAIVQVEIASNIPNTEAIAIFVEKNPTSLIGNYMFSHGAQPRVVTRIKMAESSDVKVIVKAGERYYSNSKFVEVLSNGCG